ncbi:hypothetical protein LEP1GSC062_1111 [Leptospira alexanderi serovar Manhao 3 str. L 60]|uniref:Uncharacterized protein n=1 Tax=Leptospira alexanderi serovar Manhao 3 str. L 60 TaxID=1049759 RepID=V6IES8_9LEPT|nr:hypothetical protein LEP1GSC062_1111 [Leptospira alexanderi serovar Manhao 3 str. L 60]
MRTLLAVKWKKRDYFPNTKTARLSTRVFVDYETLFERTR